MNTRGRVVGGEGAGRVYRRVVNQNGRQRKEPEGNAIGRNKPVGTQAQRIQGKATNPPKQARRVQVEHNEGIHVGRTSKGEEGKE